MPYKLGLAFARATKDYLARIALETINNLGKSKKSEVINGFIFLDTGSPEPYASRLEERIKAAEGTYIRDQARGIGFHQRDLFERAWDMGVDETYYLESDSKPDLALPKNMQLWQSVYEKDPTVDINIPGRSEKTLLTVPVEQRVSEMHGINVPMDMILRFYGYIGEMLDFAWGPKAVKRDTLSYFAATYLKLVDGKEVEITDIGHPYVAMVHAAHEGMRFGGITVDTVHPLERKKFEEGDYVAEQKRLKNVLQIVPVCFEHFCKLNALPRLEIQS
jgi:hypothetical protein